MEGKAGGLKVGCIPNTLQLKARATLIEPSLPSTIAEIIDCLSEQNPVDACGW
jgi:hypothetical protein